MEKIEHKLVEVNGLKLHVAEIGSPSSPAVVFLHGFPEIWYSWRHQMIAVANAGFRAIAPDYRGYGLSDPPPEPDKTTYADLFADLLALLQALSIPKAFLISKDFGARVACIFALLYPEKISGIITLGIPFVPPTKTAVSFHKHLPEGFYIARWEKPGRAEADFGRLDSKTVVREIIDMLRGMAEREGRTIILSLHQPGFRIVKLFSSILLLANGSVLHHGSLDLLSLNLTLMGLHLPLHVNLVEFAMESIEAIQQQSRLLLASPLACSSNKRSGVEEEGLSKTGKFTLQQLFQQSKVVDEDSCIHLRLLQLPPPTFANSRIQETMILTHRFWKNIYRTKELFACRTVSMLLSGIVLGSIFFNLTQDLVGSQERVGLFAFILTFLLSTTTEALPIFLQEREILMKETSSGSYRVSSYAIANALVYLPFLLILAILFSVPLYWLVGLNPSFNAFMHFLTLIWLILYTANSVVVCFSALVPNFIVGNSVISAVMGSFFLFSGYFISKHGIPNYWIFMHYMSLFKYPFEGFLINEFSNSDRCLDYMLGRCVVRGEDVLREEGYGDEKSRWRNYVIMLCFIFLYRFISYLILRYKCSHSGI